jgi:hypothetical protein
LVVWMLMLRGLLRRRLCLWSARTEDSHRSRIAVPIRKRRLVRSTRRKLSWSSIVLAVLVEVDELLVPHEQIADIHVSMSTLRGKIKMTSRRWRSWIS